MKNLLYTLLAAILFACSLPAAAQESGDEKNIVGGFGHFFIGPSMVQSKKLTDYLKRSDIMGTSYSPARLGYTIGGEGAARLHRFIIGGGGFGVITPSVTTDSARALAALGGGYFKIGYVFYEKPKTFMYGYASFGGSGYSLQLSNIADSASVNFNRKYPILPGKKETYGFGGFLFDLGISIKTIAIGGNAENARKRGGFMVGFDLGCLVTMPISDWEAAETNYNGNNNNDNKIVVTGPPSPASMLSPYLRITIGGGGFVNKRY